MRVLVIIIVDAEHFIIVDAEHFIIVDAEHFIIVDAEHFIIVDAEHFIIVDAEHFIIVDAEHFSRSFCVHAYDSRKTVAWQRQAVDRQNAEVKVTRVIRLTARSKVKASLGAPHSSGSDVADRTPQHVCDVPYTHKESYMTERQTPATLISEDDK
ncbi:hypothetical protein BaRGS_00015972 [Batillaria attramentaria]|uniref:Uncharacterized protein n=1 Tax=Batillaria attramentaria TaxID=370345 RepID=A0ABD0L175_9CAEN